MRYNIGPVAHSRWLILGLMMASLGTLACGFVGGAFGAAPTATPAAELPKVPIVFDVATPAVAAPATAAPQPSGPLETIMITAPLTNQGVRAGFVVAGTADPTFEQRLSILVRDQTGRVIGSALAQIQAPSGQRGPYSAPVQLPFTVPPQPGRVIVYATSARNGGLVHLSSVAVQLESDAPSNAAVPAYALDQREAIVITEPQPGSTLHGSAHVVAETLYTDNLVIEVRGTHDETLGRVMRTLDHAEGLPASLVVDVPFRAYGYGDPPGRVVIYNLDPSDGKTIHLSSVEVNLQP